MATLDRENNAESRTGDDSPQSTVTADDAPQDKDPGEQAPATQEGAVQAALSLTMQPLKVSKVNTAAQIVLAAVVLGVNGYGIADHGAVEVLVYTVAATTLVSGGAYVVTWSRRAAAMEARD